MRKPFELDRSKKDFACRHPDPRTPALRSSRRRDVLLKPMLMYLLKAALFAAGVPEAIASACVAAECTTFWLRRRVRRSALAYRRGTRRLRRELRSS